MIVVFDTVDVIEKKNNTDQTVVHVPFDLRKDEQYNYSIEYQ